jgi:hypothetical protein
VNSHNKVKPTWSIIKSERGEKANNGDITLLSNEGDKIDNCKANSGSFNNYF